MKVKRSAVRWKKQDQRCEREARRNIRQKLEVRARDHTVIQSGDF